MMNKLKLRLKLKHLRKKIDKEVEWNFGYCPNTEYFNRVIDEVDDLLEYAAEHHPEIYEEFVDTL